MIWSIYPKVILLIFIFMCVVFVLAQLKKNNSIVDYFWGLGFCMITVYLVFHYRPPYAGNEAPFYHLLVFSALIFAWGLRLSIYIFIRNYGKGEDWRYRDFRKKWGKHPVAGAFFQVFMLQGIFMFLVALPIIHIFYQGIFSFNLLHLLGFLIWFTGLFFETVGDAQLYLFKKNPGNKNKPMQYGLWKYTRHPNYFGEILVWWGIWIISIDVFHPLTTLASVISPLTITLLLTKVSGVPLTESKYKDKPEYREYINKTPALIPKFF